MSESDGMWEKVGVDEGPHSHSRIQFKGGSSTSLLYFQKLMDLITRTGKERDWIISQTLHSFLLYQEVKCVTSAHISLASTHHIA